MFISLVSIVVTYSLAPLGARASAGAVQTKFGYSYNIIICLIIFCLNKIADILQTTFEI